MKKLLLSLGMAAMVSSFALAEPIEIEFGAATSSQNPWTSKNETITRNGQDWSIDIQGQDSPYFGAEWTSKNDTWKGFQFGKGKAAISGMTVSTTIPGKVTKVVVNSAAGSGDGTKWDMSVAVGETAFSCNDAASTALTDSQADYTFTGSASGTVVIKWANTGNSTKALYYRNITITYEAEAGVVSAPTMNPAAGWIMQGETVALSAQEGASIFYTTDNNEPTEASTAYTDPIAINNDMTIKAIARLNDVNSDVKEAAYTVYPVNNAEAPLTTDQAIELIDKSFDQNIEVFVNGTITEISELSTQFGNATYTILTEGATNSLLIFRGKYIDGATFTEEGQLAVGDKVIVKGKLTTYKDTKEMDTNSSIVSIEKAPVSKCEAPKFSVESGTTVNKGDVVTISTSTEGAVIVYTINDGEAVTSESNTVDVTIDETCTIVAKATKEGLTDSDNATAVYTVQQLAEGESEYVFDFTGEEAYGMVLLSGITTENNPDPYTCKGQHVTLTLNGTTRWWNATEGNELRFYTESSFTVAGQDEHLIIKKIELIDAINSNWEVATAEAPATYAAVNGYENGVWTGSQKSVTFKNIKDTKNTALHQIKVLYEIPAAVETIEAEDAAPARYFNLQGVEVANPANGLYIKVQGKKATKVIL